MTDTHTAARAAEAATLHRYGVVNSPTYQAAQQAEKAMLQRLMARPPSAADIASAAECAAAGKHLWAADVTKRPCCVVCGEMG